MTKRKMTEASEAALSAVEEALKIDFGGDAGTHGTPGPPEASAAHEEPAEAASQGRRTGVSRGSADAARRAPAKSRETAEPPAAEQKPAERTRSRRAANDDLRSVGTLLYALQKRPPMTPKSMESLSPRGRKWPPTCACNCLWPGSALPVKAPVTTAPRSSRCENFLTNDVPPV